MAKIYQFPNKKTTATAFGFVILPNEAGEPQVIQVDGGAVEGNQVTVNNKVFTEGANFFYQEIDALNNVIQMYDKTKNEGGF